METSAARRAGLGRRPARSERGQAIVLVAAAAVALVGMLAVVVDTSYLYAEQRRMQNAADAAVMAGAQNWLASTNQLAVSQAVVDARNYASFNGYANSAAAGNGAWDPAPDDGVKVSVPPSSGPNSGSSQYVEVLITRPITTFFSGIFNVSSVQVTTRAVARGMSGTIDAAIIALGDTADAIKSDGNSVTNVYGNMYSAGGVKCEAGTIMVYDGASYAVGGIGPNCAGRGQLISPGGIYVGSAVPRIYDPAWPSSESLVPDGPSNGNWLNAGQPVEADGYVHVYPGTYNSISIVAAGPPVKFQPGVYRLLGQADNPALNINGTVTSAGPVQFVLESGALHVQAQATGILYSGPEYNNILIYAKRSDGGNAVKVAGSSSLAYVGTIYAPQANVYVAGNAAPSVRGQVVARSVTLIGSGTTAVQYDDSKVGVVIRPALVE